jgi:hypothetical protein
MAWALQRAVSTLTISSGLNCRGTLSASEEYASVSSNSVGNISVPSLHAQYDRRSGNNLDHHHLLCAPQLMACEDAADLAS